MAKHYELSVGFRISTGTYVGLTLDQQMRAVPKVSFGSGAEAAKEADRLYRNRHVRSVEITKIDVKTILRRHKAR